MINIKDINLENLESAKFISELPEFYELKNIFENNEWHNETSYEHILATFKSYQKLLEKYDLNFLNEKVTENSKKDLLKLAVLFHDIAKADTIEHDETGKSIFPDHEIKSGIKAKKILKRFNISTAENDYISSIISVHDKGHRLLNVKEIVEQTFNIFRKEEKNIYKEIMLLCLADVMGSKLTEKDPAEYKFRINTYKNLLELK